MPLFNGKIDVFRELKFSWNELYPDSDGIGLSGILMLNLIGSAASFTILRVLTMGEPQEFLLFSFGSLAPLFCFHLLSIQHNSPRMHGSKHIRRKTTLLCCIEPRTWFDFSVVIFPQRASCSEHPICFLACCPSRGDICTMTILLIQLFLYQRGG